MAQSKQLRIYQEEWVRLYDSGQSFKQIASTYGVNHSSVSRLIRECRSPRKRGLEEDTIAKIGEYHEAGMLQVDIAKTLNLSPSTIGRVLFRHFGIHPRHKTSTLETLAPQIQQLYLEGACLSEIAQQFGISTSAVHHYLERGGIRRRTFSETSRRYRLDETYFDFSTLTEFDIKKRSFSLGVIWGRGHLYEDSLKSSLRFHFPVTQQDMVLDWMADFTEADPSRFFIPERPTPAQTFEFRLHSNRWIQELKTLGFPHDLPRQARLDEASFWRGYLQVRASHFPQYQMIYLSFESERLALAARDFLTQQLEVPVHQNCLRPKSLKNPWQLIFRRQAILEKILQQYPFL